MGGLALCYPPLSMRGPGEVDIPNEAHLLGSILSRRVTDISFYPTPPILTATPNGDSDGGRALGLALGSDIQIKITRIKITRIRITRTRITKQK